MSVAMFGTKMATVRRTQKVKIVETYWHDHLLESSWEALSDGTISFSVHPFSGKKIIFWIFLKNLCPQLRDSILEIRHGKD
jgi:hypothetical protein